MEWAQPPYWIIFFWKGNKMKAWAIIPKRTSLKDALQTEADISLTLTKDIAKLRAWSNEKVVRVEIEEIK